MQPDEQKQDSAAAPEPLKARPGFWRIMTSVFSAAFGVQSSKRHQEDFSSSSITPFIVGGVIFTLLFISTLVMIVKWVLPG